MSRANPGAVCSDQGSPGSHRRGRGFCLGAHALGTVILSEAKDLNQSDVTVTTTNVKCLLLLSSKLGYQFRGFAEAARRLRADVVIGSDRCKSLDDPWRDGAVPLKFEKPEAGAERLLTAVGSLQLQGRDPYEYLTTLMQAHTARQPLPSLLPQPSEV